MVGANAAESKHIKPNAVYFSVDCLFFITAPCQVTRSAPSMIPRAECSTIAAGASTDPGPHRAQISEQENPLSPAIASGQTTVRRLARLLQANAAVSASINDNDVSPNAPQRVSAMTWLRYRMVRQRFWLGMVIRALNAGAADTKHCRHALLPTRVIAGHGATASRAATAMERAPWIRIRRLRVANLRFAQQRSRNDQKRGDPHTHHCLPIVLFACVACYQLTEMLQ